MLDERALGTALCRRGARRRDLDALEVFKFSLPHQRSQRPETMLDRRARSTALCMQIFSSVGARRLDFEPLLVFQFLLRYPKVGRPETMPNRRALGTALCMQIFSSIGARRRDFEALGVFHQNGFKNTNAKMFLKSVLLAMFF